MNPNDSKYQSLYKTCEKAWPQKPKTQVQQEAVKLWKKIKAGEKSYEDTIKELKQFVTSEKSSSMDRFVRLMGNVKKKSTLNDNKSIKESNTDEGQPDILEIPTDKPSTSKDKPSTSKDKPSTSKDNPSTSKDNPLTSKDKPSTSKDKPSISKDKPSSSKDKPADDPPTPKQPSLKPTHAQDELKKSLSNINSQIAALTSVDSGIGLSSEQDALLTKLKKNKVEAEKKLKKKLQDVANQKKFRAKRKEALNALTTEYPEVAEKIRKLDFNTGKVGRPALENEYPDLHADILAIVVPESAADEKRRSEVYNTVRSLDVLKHELEKRGYNISRTATYYRLVPANIRHIDGKRHVHTVPVQLSKPQSTLRKSHSDSHFAMSSVNYAMEIGTLFPEDKVFFLSQDDKARVPLGIPISKKQTCILMALEYKVVLPDHDFPLGENAKLIPSVYASCLPTKEEKIGYSGPTYIAIRSAKHDKSSARSHSDDFNKLIKLGEFRKAALTNEGSVKPIVLISVDGGPDESPKRQQTKAAWINHFCEHNMDVCFVFTHAPGQSAYNKVERRMAPLSKATSGVILPFDTFGSHLDGSNKTKDEALERENFAAAGKVLAEVWGDLMIDTHPVVAEYIKPTRPMQENQQGDKAERRKKTCSYCMTFFKTEKEMKTHKATCTEKIAIQKSDAWIATHVQQSQYLLQIVKCGEKECCGEWNTNYLDFFPNRFIPPPLPLATVPNGLSISSHNGRFRSLFQTLYLHEIKKFDVQGCYDRFYPSLNIPDKQGKTLLQKRTCNYCNYYSSTIQQKELHQKGCGMKPERKKQARKPRKKK